MVTSVPFCNVMLTKCLLRTCISSSWPGSISYLFCSFPERWKGEAGSICFCLIFCLLSRYWVIITWSLDLHRKEVAFYKVTSAIHMATHFVLSVSQRRSEEPSKQLTVCSLNLHREAGRRSIFRPVSYLLWHFPFSACAWNTHSQLVARNTCRPGAGKAWTCALKIRSIAREISPSC